MLSLKYIRENSDFIQESLKLKKTNIDISIILNLDIQRRKCLKNVEKLRAEKNQISNIISNNKKQNIDSKDFIMNMRTLSNQIKSLEINLKKINEEINDLIYNIPNIIHDSVQPGNDGSDNIIIKEWGEKPQFSFPLKDHLELGETLGLLDFKKAVKMAGSGFPLYIGKGALLERALINFMLDFHINSGYQELLPPVLAHKNAMQNTGQLPKFEEDMYRIPDDVLYCIPTAEVPVTNYHQDEILNENELPKKYVAYTSCFRREAGSYGKDTKGLTRLHQFNKVELVKFTHPDDSYSELESLLDSAEKVLQSLGLHYRVVQLCAGDLSFSAAKCYDIEVWSPFEKKYLEVSSCSNFETFQSTRANIRFRNTKVDKTEYVHTLNGSGIATPRLMIALLESCQRKDGSILLPEELYPYMKIKEINLL